MNSAPFPADESQRLETLRQYSILDTIAEPVYDDVVHLAAQICGVPIALISLVDADRQWFKARFGLDATQTPREVAFCSHAILGDDVFVVDDASCDVRFHDNPLVVGGPEIRFYAGAPIVAPDGSALGTVCVIDRQVRKLSEAQLAALQALSRQVVSHLELHLQADKREQLVAELRQAKEVAERANRAKSDFLATMSHEIRTPMNAVLGYASLLQETVLDACQRDYLGVIDSSGRALLSLIDDVLDYAKIEAGGLELEDDVFEVRAAVADVVRMLQPKAAAKGIQLAAEVAAEVPACLLGDASRTGQVLLNLVGNAVKFTDQGCVRVVVRCEGDDRLRVEVVDTGIGIAADRIDALFERFVQADSSTRRRFGGTGLGLAISRRIVEGMRGRIGARSAAGAGSTFWFVVPLRPAPVSQLPAGIGESADDQRPWLAAGGSRPRVLLVEDNPVNQHLAHRLLAALECEVEVAADGLQAVAALARDDYSLVLMDCLMPEMDGYEATREIRRREIGSDRHVPIVAMTANAMASDKIACAEAGMDDYLAKPFRKLDLQRVLQRWIAAGQVRAE